MEYNYQQVNNVMGQINPDIILRLPNEVYIPNDPENTDWQTYQAWLAEGNTPLPPA